MVGATLPGILAVGWTLGSLLTYILSLGLFDRLWPWKKLVITAEFNGILPKEVRKKALVARDHFDELFLIVDEQNRWKSALFPDLRPYIILSRYTQPDAELQLLFKQLKLELSDRPPPKITASGRLAK